MPDLTIQIGTASWNLNSDARCTPAGVLVGITVVLGGSMGVLEGCTVVEGITTVLMGT